MADLSQTAGNVVTVSNENLAYVTAGETITAGMPVYMHTDGQYYKALNDTAAHCAVVGIALNGASDNQKMTIMKSGTINLGATLTVGEVYCVSNTAGKICPVADIGAAEFTTVLGIAVTAANLNMNINSGGVAHA